MHRPDPNRTTIAKNVLATLLLALVLACLGCRRSVYKKTLYETRIAVWKVYSSTTLLSVHASPVRVLQIGDFRFYNLGGKERGFEEIKEWRTLVFVNEEKGAS